MISAFSEGLVYFAIYSVIGWICETVCCSIQARKFMNRGFLNGPYCPIYGIGGVIILMMVPALGYNPVLVFLAAVVSSAVLEFFTSWGMEKLFGMRWWDYSGKKLQFRGRISLITSLLFGLMGCGVVFGLHPLLAGLMARIPQHYVRILGNGVVALFLVDLLATLNKLLGFTQRLSRIQADIRELREMEQEHAWYDGKDLTGSFRRLREIYAQDGDNPETAQRLEKIDGLLERVNIKNRVAKAYPKLKTGELDEALDAVRENTGYAKGERPARLAATAKALGRRSVQAGKVTAKTMVAQLDFHHLFWVFVIACVIGYVVETIYCFLTTGRIESRQGMLYGPFNQVYGFGAVLMVMFLTHLTQKNDRWLFFGGALLGGGFEVLCSFIQESAFGSVSWDYTGKPFSVAGGRTSLVFMFFWGILGLWFMKGVHPKLTELINRIPKRQGVTFTSLLAVFLCANMLLSAVAVERWVSRSNGQAPDNVIDELMDEYYPDEKMEQVYPNMIMLVED